MALRFVLSVTASDLITLHVQGDSTVGSRIPLSAQFFWANFTDNAVVVDHREVLTSDTDNDADFIRRTTSTKYHEVIQLVTLEFILSRGHLS
jgi:hypothetical protein